MELWELKAEIPRSHAEAAELAALETGLGGWSILEDATSDRAWVVGIFGSASEAAAHWAELEPALASRAKAPPVTRRLPDADWKNSYRDHFKAWSFGRLHWVPVWERGAFSLPQGHSVLWLDPGMAFGTGNHETTRLCIQRLVEFEGALPSHGAAGLSVVDAGCGSGILALSAALLGFKKVRGFDNDPEAVRVSMANAELNGVTGVPFNANDLAAGLRGGADVVLANIQADVLCANARALLGAISAGGLLAMSGILASECASVRAAFAAVAPDWDVDSRVLGEWSDLALRRPPS